MLAPLYLHTVAWQNSLSWLRFWLIIIRMGSNCHWLKMTPICPATPCEQLEARLEFKHSAMHTAPQTMGTSLGALYEMKNFWIWPAVHNEAFQECAACLKHCLDCCKSRSAHRSASPYKSCQWLGLHKSRPSLFKCLLCCLTKKRHLSSHGLLSLQFSAGGYLYRINGKTVSWEFILLSVWSCQSIS